MGDVYVLGISGKFNQASQRGEGHHPSAALLKNGRIVALASEERFVRVKYAVGHFPVHAILCCLAEAGITIGDLAAVGWSADPYRALQRWADRSYRPAKRALVTLAGAAQRNETLRKLFTVASSQIQPWREVERQRAQLYDQFGDAARRIPFICVDHHLAHAASAYYASGFDESTVITWDGSGDSITGSVSYAKGGRLHLLHEFDRFSIGDFYYAIHCFLKLSDEGSLMGLAAYGQNRGLLAGIADPKRLTMDYSYIHDDATMVSPKLIARLGPPRREDEPLTDYHRDIAAELQDIVEAFGFEIVRRAVAETGCRNLAFAGGVALNATMNGKIGRSPLADRIFVQPEAGDGGGALGAAYVAYQRLGYHLEPEALQHAYWGSAFTDDEIEATLRTVKVRYHRLDRPELIESAAQALVDGQLLGWFQGRAEWGPRALGARSILADPRDVASRDRVNSAVKYRDHWRPFAPSMLAEAGPDYLEGVFEAPFMITTFPVKTERKQQIAAVVHADGTTRPQLVRREVHPLYYDLIQRFAEKTGVPAVLNTSFNLKGEPIVNSPRDALRTFFSSGLDRLYMGSFLVEK